MTRRLPSCSVPCSIPQWREAVVDRARSNFETFKNHTAILFWSLGNESYAGDDIEAMNTYFKEKQDGRFVHYESSFYDRNYEETISDVESRMYAKLFRENRDRIDGIIVSLPNFGFEIGIINAISVADLNVPVLVQACDDENDKVDLDSRRDAFCGKISVCNNLYQYGIPFTDTTLHTYSIYSDLLVTFHQHLQSYGRQTRFQKDLPERL